LLAKDSIKEPLLDVLGAANAAQSRRLSDASFAAMFRIAGEWVANGSSFLLEGNFRPGEHEPPLRAALETATSVPQLAQVLCRVPEAQRLARLAARENNPGRHAGHRFGERLSAMARAQAVAAEGERGPANVASDAFLDLPSTRFVHDGASHHTVLSNLDNWMNLRAASL
jgi:hypothetical protein